MVFDISLPPADNWGGYAGDTHWINPSGYRYSSALEFTIPNAAYNPAPNNAYDVMLIWAGIGGFSGALWQAGIVYGVDSGGGISLSEFADYCPNTDPSSCAANWQSGFRPLSVGDTVSIIVTWDSNVGSTYTIQALGPHNSWTLSCTGSCPYTGTPDLSTGEVIVEPAWESGPITSCSVPSGGGYCVLPNFQPIIVPNNYWTVPGGSWAASYQRMDAEGQYPSGSTFANPGYITSGYYANSGTFQWTYGTSPTS